ncbi:MAG: tetratricopeptide repeat protein, partial [Pseudomonadota bacterium]
RKAIAELIRSNPEWQPPQNLLDLIEQHEVRTQLQAHEQAGEWRELLDVAQSHPRQIGCERIDNLWRVARAHAELGQQDQAVEVYAQVIEQCDQVDHRIATLQKAKTQVDENDLGELFALEQGRDKPSSAARRIAKLRSSTNKPKESPEIQALFDGNLSPGMLEDAEVEVMGRRHGPGAERLGWVYYEAERWDEAAKWFSRALRWKPGPKPAEGLARSYAKLGRVNEAAALVETWPRELGPIVEDLRKEWIADAFARGDHDLLLEQTEQVTMPWARNLRGWSFIQLDRPTEASHTFAEVLRDDETPLSARREAAYGLAWATIAIGSLGDAESIVAAHDFNPDHRYELHAEVLLRRAQRAFGVQDYRTYLVLMEQRRGFAEPSRELLLQEAWARYHRGEKHTAKRIFEQLHRVYATKETKEGLAVVGNSIDRLEF